MVQLQKMRAVSQIIYISPQKPSIVFTIIFAITGLRFHISSTILGRVSSFDYVTYSSTDTDCQQGVSVEKYITEPTKLTLGVVVLERLTWTWTWGKDDGAYRSFVFEEIARIFVM